MLLLMDNSSTHAAAEFNSLVKVLQLPANTTGVLQPLDQGVLRAIKQSYKMLQLSKIFNQILK